MVKNNKSFQHLPNDLAHWGMKKMVDVLEKTFPKALSWNKLLLLMLTFNVRGPSYLSLTRSISWLLMPWLHMSPGLEAIYLSCCMILTLNVRGPSYLGLTRSVSWLLMPWRRKEPGHQQPWYWLYRICRSLSYLRKDFKYLCPINVEEWHKM